MSQDLGLNTIDSGTAEATIRLDHEISKDFGKLSLSSQTMHADDHLNTYADVAPAMHVSTTFRYNSDPQKLIASADMEPGARYDAHIYSRHTAPNTTRLESILSQILHGPTLTYSSGLSAFHAALVHLNPRRISIGEGYHGCHGVISVLHKLTGLKKLPLDCAASELQKGDVVHIETPINPTGLMYNIREFAEKAHGRGAFLIVDSTFGPPPLQDPLALGADLVLHSGTKYFGGHSDMLCGILAVHPKHCRVNGAQIRLGGDQGNGKQEEQLKGNWWAAMELERTFLGSVMGNLEGWLGVRSVRTLELRVRRQSKSAGLLVGALYSAKQHRVLYDTSTIDKTIHTIFHASIQVEEGRYHPDSSWPRQQMPNGYGSVFAILMQKEEYAKRLPSKLKLFHHATSLGGVESLVEWRAMSDAGVDRRLLRFSMGVEAWDDLWRDLVAGLEAVLKEEEEEEEALKSLKA